MTNRVFNEEQTEEIQDTGKDIDTGLHADINNNPQVTLGRTDLYRET